MTPEELDKLIYDKTWKGEYWGEGGVIDLAEARFDTVEVDEMAGALSALSSTYYSAAGRAKVEMDKAPILKKLTWGFRAFSCFKKAARLSEKLEKLIGRKEMNPDELDVRARILFRSKRYNDALEVTHEALDRPDLKPDSALLLRMGLAEILERLDFLIIAEKTYQDMLPLARVSSPTASVRFYRSMAGFYQRRKYKDHQIRWAQQAFEIAESHGLTDQLEKIRPLLK